MANPIQFANGPLPQPAPNTTLTSSIPSSGASTPTVASATYLPSTGPFLIVVDNERITVDSISGTTLTILSGGRAQEGTSAAAHSSGAAVYQVLSVGTLATHIDDRAAKGVVDQVFTASNVVLSTTAGTYTTMLTGNAIAVKTSRRYRITCTGGFDLLAGGSGFAIGDSWQSLVELDENGGGFNVPTGGGPVQIGRSAGTVSHRYPPVPLTLFYTPASNLTATFRWRAQKQAGAAAVTSTMETGSGTAPWYLTVEDIGAA